MLMDFASGLEREEQTYQEKLRQMDEMKNADKIKIGKAKKIAEANLPFLYDEFEED